MAQQVEQSFQSHTYHPVATYVASLFWLLALVLLIGQAFFGWPVGNWIIAAILLTLAPVVAITRWYTVRLQDRIIMLETKVRAAELDSKAVRLPDRDLGRMSPRSLNPVILHVLKRLIL